MVRYHSPSDCQSSSGPGVQLVGEVSTEHSYSLDTEWEAQHPQSSEFPMHFTLAELVQQVTLAPNLTVL